MKFTTKNVSLLPILSGLFFEKQYRKTIYYTGYE